jgi:hypothetical protein
VLSAPNSAEGHEHERLAARHALIVVDGRPDRRISDTRKVVEVFVRGRRVDRP